MSENVGMINLCHFAIYDVTDEDAAEFMEFTCVAKVAGDTPVGKGIYTHFIDKVGGVRADLTVLRLGENHFRVVDGGYNGPRDFAWMKRLAEDHNYNKLSIVDRSNDFGCIGLWGPNARTTLQKLVPNPEALSHENFPFVAVKNIEVAGKTVSAFRISYVGEQGWELHFELDDGLSIWDALFAEGVLPVGIETYANSRRLEKSLRLQNADILTEYNLLEVGLERKVVKAADFYGKEAYLKIREREHQAAYLCTLTMMNNTDASGVKRYPLGACPIMDPETGETLVDSEGRRSYTTSIVYGPSIGKNIALAYLPYEYCEEGRELEMDYMDETYKVKVEAVGYRALYDPENLKPRS
jgi:glycine cleavage system aminomethyltransferase T